VAENKRFGGWNGWEDYISFLCLKSRSPY
jgi:hypothetical protein